MRVPIRFAFGALTAVTLLVASRAVAQPDSPPKLVVLVVIDQMRADYIDRYGHQWSGGLKRLIDQGATFRQARFPYLGTITCAGHATIATGTMPARHGMIENSWWDRAGQRVTTCTDDPKVTPIGYNGVAKERNSARLLRIPTLADELRIQPARPGRIVSVSLKARSTISMAGQRPDVALWFEDSGVWATSSAFTSGPHPAVAEFIRANPVERDFGKIWERSLSSGAYIFDDNAAEERPVAPWTSTFPHPLRGKGDKADQMFYSRWQRSPFADEYVARMAVHLANELRMGQGQRTDYLSVSFSSLDLAGHEFGPRSHEVQDLLVRLDRSLQHLLEELDRLVGSREYVLALSSDHGVGAIPEQMVALGLDAGRIVPQQVGERLQRALVPHLGDVPHVASVLRSSIYFAPGVYERLIANPAAMVAAIEAVGAVPGVERVFRSDQMSNVKSQDDPLIRATLSYVPGRSGDLTILPKPYWIMTSTAAYATTHGTTRIYDSHVPLILFGRGIEPGEYWEPVSPADIAPTLAMLVGVTLAQPDGRVLTEALRSPQRKGSDPNGSR